MAEGGASFAAGLACMVSPPVPAEAQACSDDNAQDEQAAQPRPGTNPRFARQRGRFDLVFRSVYALIHRLSPRSIRSNRIHLIPGRRSCHRALATVATTLSAHRVTDLSDSLH